VGGAAALGGWAPGTVLLGTAIVVVVVDGAGRGCAGGLVGLSAAATGDGA
jgi:hypothetical protein